MRLFGDDRVGLAAGRGFRVFVAVGVGGADGDFVSGIFGLQGVVAVGRARDRLAVAQPLVLDAVGVIAVAVPDFGGEFAADFRLATDVDDAGMVRGRRRGGFAFNLCGFAAGRCFVVRRVVGVARLHADFVADVIAAQHVGFAVCAVYRLAVAQPLVGDVVRYAVFVGNGCGKRGVFFCLTRDGDAARVVGGRRAAFVVNGGGDAVFARLYLPALRLADAHGVVLVALLFAIGDGIDGEGRAVLPFGDGDGMRGGLHVAVVGGAVLDGDIDGDIALGVARHRQLPHELVEIARHFMPRPRGEGGEDRIAAEIGPGVHEGDFGSIRVGLDGFQHVGVPVGVGVAVRLEHFVAFAAKFGQRRDFAARRRHARQHRQILHQLARPFILGEAGVVGVVKIHAEYVNHVIARIEQLVAAFIAAKAAVGGEGGEHLSVQPVFLQIMDDIAEQLLVGLGAAALIIPPHPVAVGLVQRAEEEGNLGAVIAHRVLAGLDDGVQPAIQLRILVAAGQEALQVNLGAVGLAAGHIPVGG